jgi:hypothetical protein
MEPFLPHFSWHCFNEQAFGDEVVGLVSHGSEMALHFQLINQICFFYSFIPSSFFSLPRVCCVTKKT